MSRRILACAVLIAAAAALSACGKSGQLERPGPLFGKARSAPASDNPNQQDPTRPMQTIDPRDRGSDQIPQAQPAPAQ